MPAMSMQEEAGDYLLERWLPLLGPDKYALVCVLRHLCYQNPATGEFVTEFSLDLADLAAKIGKSRATLCRLLHRNEEGVIVEEQPGGSSVPSLLNHFVQVLPQQRYSQKHGRKVQAVNRFQIIWSIPPVPGEEASYTPCTSESQSETLKVPQRDPATRQQNPAPACACSCPFVQADVILENLKMRQQKIVSPLVPEEISSNGAFHRTIRERQPDCAMALRNLRRTPSPEKALGGGEASRVATGQQSGRAGGNASHHTSSRVNRQPEQEPPIEFALALAEAERVAGGVLIDLLQQYGDPNPLVGMRTILVALVEAGAPNERLCDLAYLGRNRLRRFQLRGGHIQTTVPGYFINLMRNLASEAKGKDWETARIESEDRVKHEDMLRRIAARGMAKPGGCAARAEREPEAVDEEADVGMAPPAPEEPMGVTVEEAPPAADARAESDDPPPAAPNPASFLPDEVEVADAATVATWRDRVPDPRGGQPRSVSMLWGFVRQALQPQLNLPRQQYLTQLTPKWDAERPRKLLLLSPTPYTARFVAQVLRREIDSHVGKLLADYFDECQVAYAPGQEEPV